MTRPDDDIQEPPTVDLEVEVPGTPQQVWEAIATGPGISAWMQPTEVEPRVGGRFGYDMGLGSGMDTSGTVTGWDPPHRFATETTWQRVEGAPARIATEWIVTARDGGTSVVRMVMSGFGTGAGWEGEVEGMAGGMRTALDTLRHYLTHFPGRRAAWIRVSGPVQGPRDRTWAGLTGELGVAGAGVGDRVAAGTGAPPFAGVVERVYEGAYGHDLLLRIDQPAPGFVEVFLVGEAGPAGIQVALYGDGAPAVAARVEPAWRAWMAAR